MPDRAKPSPQAAKVSEMIMEFAAPLLDLDRDGAADVDVLRSLMMMVELCWNLPVFEATDPEAYVRFKQGFDSVTQNVPPEIGSMLAILLENRRTRFGRVPLLIHVRVEEDGPGRARLLAEARMPATDPNLC
jgi:hypothetical protein